MQVYTTYYDSPLGQLELKATGEYVVSVLFREGRIEVEDNHEMLQRCIEQLNEYFSGKRQVFDFPMQQSGSAFQRKVWQLLEAIPYGKTISYTELTRQFGDPKAIRAVASANGKNNLAIVVPCHRVIGSNATLTGYAGGLWRKQWLLDHERRCAHGVEQASLF